MTQAFLAVVLMVLSVPVLAEQDRCVNYAKYGAIRAYKAEMGTVQGSHGIEYVAELKGTQGVFSDYVVSIYDDNEDGDTWQVDYAVRTETLAKSCKLIFVKKRTSLFL